MSPNNLPAVISNDASTTLSVDPESFMNVELPSEDGDSHHSTGTAEGVVLRPSEPSKQPTEDDGVRTEITHNASTTTTTSSKTFSKQDPPSTTKLDSTPRFVRSNTINSTTSGQNNAILPAALSRALTNLAPRPSTKAPKDALKAVYAAGEYKAGLTMDVLFVQAFMAGIFIGMAGQLYISVHGGLLGAVLFPTGLIAVIFTSAELFTGDSLVFVASWLGGRVSFKSLLRNWTVSWIANFCGCIVWAYFLSFLSGALDDHKDFAIKVALKKADQAWGSIFLKGIGANFMVCMAVWQATCAEEVAGKILAMWFPVVGFVLMGFDHVIANQYLIPIGMMYGADVSTFHLFFRALAPATLGNLIGGGVGVGAVYWYVFDSMNTNLNVTRRIPRAFHSVRNVAGRTPSASRQTSFVSDDQTKKNQHHHGALVQRRNQTSQHREKQDLATVQMAPAAADDTRQNLEDVELGDDNKGQ